MLLCVSFGAKSQGIEFFHGSFDEAKALAKAENKPLFIDVYTSWCGPCKKLSKTIFPQKIVGDYFNQNFVCFKLQADKKGGENQKIADSYNVAAYPTLMWLDGEGKLMHVSTGFKEPARLIAEAKIVFDKDKRVGTLIEKWESGDRSKQVALKYFSYDKNSKGEFDAYFNGLSENEKLDSSTFIMISNLRLDLESDLFKFVVSHRKDYQKVAYPFKILRTIDSKIENELLKNFDTDKYNSTLQKYEDLGFTDLDLFAKRTEWKYCLKNDNYVLFEKSANEYISTYHIKRPYVYSELINALFQQMRSEKFSEFKNCKIALVWADNIKKNSKDASRDYIVMVKALAVAGEKIKANAIGAEYLKILSVKNDRGSSFEHEYLTSILKQIE